MLHLNCTITCHIPVGADPLAFFRDSPQFAQMRQMIQQDPQLLAQFMEDFGRSNPNLLQVGSQKLKTYDNCVPRNKRFGHLENS